MKSISQELVYAITTDRNQGRSYKEISKKQNISPTTVSKYCKDILISDSQKFKLKLREISNHKQFAERFAKPKRIKKPELNVDLAFVLGHLFFDGAVCPEPKRYVVEYTNASLSLVQEFSKKFSKLFGVGKGKINFYQRKGLGWYQIYFYSKEVADFFLLSLILLARVKMLAFLYK